MDYKGYIAECISKALNDDLDKVLGLLSVPPNENMGDVAFPCFSYAKQFRKAPAMIAQEVLERIKSDSDFDEKIIAKMEVAGGYLNFFLNRNEFISSVVSDVVEKGVDFARSDEGNNKKVIVEFSSPNIAKPFHIGHLFSTSLGNSIEKIYSYLGYDTVKINHLGDWGTQFGKLISAYKRWGVDEDILKDPINELLKIYVKFHQKAEENPSLEDEARMYFKKLEDGDEEIVRLWKFFVEVSMKEFSRVYNMLNISFDSYAGESFYQDKMPEVIEMLEEKGLLEDSEGARVVTFGDMPPCIIIKKDGTTIYATRDIAAAIYRKRHYDFHKNIYVVGLPQTLHFKQVFGVVDKMGFGWADDCVHVGFGTVRFPDKKLSTRHGDVVFLEDVLNESIAKTREIIENSSTTKEIENVDEVATKVGIGAILFTFLRNARERDIVFTWEDILDFEGESGPYVQYSYARGKSILRKAEEQNIEYRGAKLDVLDSQEEFALVKLIKDFPEAIRNAANKYEPSIVTRHIVDVAQAFNKFYNSCSILKAEEDVMKARLNIVEASCICIKTGLNLLGIEEVEKM
ncbi:MAG TPA: arginine--tRNA ligase [Clostridiaceae bacterium]|jgi:arginyl-tRNA synthetase|nr:arginine--tRNA ligase [Clostridiaceae bacterium]